VSGQSPARRARAGGLILAALAVVLLAAGFGIGGQLDAAEPEAGAMASPAPAEPTEAPPAAPATPRPTPPTPVIPEVPATPEPTPTPKPDVAKGPTHRVATRVVVPELGIDLPVARQKSSYPSCDIAMYLTRFEQPGQGGPVYLYAHARRGMFLELLEQSQRRNGAALVGMEIHVYTGDNLKFRYEITRVRRHARDFGPVYAARGETIWLQTSEGPNASYPKLQVAGELVGRKKVGHDEAHPKPHPRAC
jgi:hypothetical protein